MDDLYTYKVKVEDKAGNVTEKSVMFSVNRYGSVYVLDTETKKWLSTGEDDYTYINEEKPIGVIEYNVDTVDVSTLTSNRDGDLTNLIQCYHSIISAHQRNHCALFLEINICISHTRSNYIVVGRFPAYRGHG